MFPCNFLYSIKIFTILNAIYMMIAMYCEPVGHDAGSVEYSILLIPENRICRQLYIKFYIQQIHQVSPTNHVST